VGRAGSCGDQGFSEREFWVWGELILKSCMSKDPQLRLSLVQLD